MQQRLRNACALAVGNEMSRFAIRLAQTNGRRAPSGNLIRSPQRRLNFSSQVAPHYLGVLASATPAKMAPSASLLHCKMETLRAAPTVRLPVPVGKSSNGTLKYLLCLFPVVAALSCYRGRVFTVPPSCRRRVVQTLAEWRLVRYINNVINHVLRQLIPAHKFIAGTMYPCSHRRQSVTSNGLRPCPC